MTTIPDLPRTLIAIPAREASARLPGKLLADVAGRPLIAYALERAAACGWADVALVTDSEAIARAGEAAVAGMSGGRVRVILDERAAGNGTLRIARAVDRLSVNRNAPRYQVVVNLQGDQVAIDESDLHAAVARHWADFGAEGVGVTTLVEELEERDVHNRDVVKAACNFNTAYWFDRGPHFHGWRRHVGVYVFSRPTLRRILNLYVHPAALAASLEQLTWVCAGVPCAVVRAERATWAVNTAEDLEAWRAMIGKRDDG